MNLVIFEKFQWLPIVGVAWWSAPEARKNVAQRVSAGYKRVEETSPGGAKDRSTFVLRHSGSCLFDPLIPSADALGYILSRLRRWSMTRIRFLLVGFAVLLFPILLPGQQRPLLTEDPRVTAPGTVTTEVGLGYLD